MALKYNKAKVWVIDDEENIHDLLRLTLGHTFDLEFFTHPSKILAAAESALPDVFVMDYALPEKNGVEVLQELRDRGIEKPVIILSGYTTCARALEFIKLGAMDVVEKPFAVERFLFSVSRAVAAGMASEARDSLIEAYAELAEAQDGLINHYEFLLASAPNSDSALSATASERVARAKKLVNFIRQKQDMLHVMVGKYTED